MRKKSFALNKRIKSVKNKEFAIHGNFNRFQDEYQTMELGASPFEEEWEYRSFLRLGHFNRKTKYRLMQRYNMTKSQADEVLSQMEYRALAVEGGGFKATKAELYRRNLLKTIKDYNKDDLEEVIWTTSKGGKETKLTLRDFTKMIERMSLEELDRLSKADIVPDFRAFGSNQETMKGNNLANIGLYASEILSRGANAYLNEKYIKNAQKFDKIDRYNMIQQTMPKQAREKIEKISKLTGKLSAKQLEMERYWALYKIDKLYYVSTSGRVYIPFVSKDKEKEIMEMIARREKA